MGVNRGRLWRLLEKTSALSNGWVLDRVLDDDSCRTLAFLNAHAVNNAIWNPEFYNFLMESDFLLRDGIGVKLAMKLFGFKPGDNLNGTDLIPKIIAGHRNYTFSIYGSSADVLDMARTRLHDEAMDNIISMEHGFHDFETYFAASERDKPDIIILCMGMPKQELLAAELIKRRAAKLIICAGGWVDFYSGAKKRAPLWVQRLSMEWVYRLFQEPKRLGKRYTLDVFYYFYVVLISRFLIGEK